MYSRLAYAFGVFNHGAAGWAQCLWPRLVDCRVTFGSPYTESADYSRTRCVLVWGTNPAATWPVQAAGIMDARQRGARLIVVDPWLSETAAKADLWLQLRPGTDTALALSMLHVILGEGLHDRAFVERWTVGFGELARHVEPCTPEWGERVTRVPAPLIREAARAYAAARPACLYRCVALDQLHDSVQACRAVSLLVAVTGNVGVPGGNVLPSVRGEISQNTLEFIGHGWMPQEEQAKRPGYDRYPLLCGELSPVPSAHMPTLWENMATGVPQPIRAALIFGSNALVSYSNTRRVREALDRLEFLVVADLFLTPTAERADLVLPASSWLERNNLISSFQSSATCTLVQQRAATLGEARSDIDIVLDLARRLGLADRFWESEEALFDHLLRPTGLTFRDLARLRRLQAPLSFRSYEQKGFATPSGKVELYSSLLEKAGCAPLPTWTEPPSSAAAAAAPPGSAARGDTGRPADPRAEYPYILTTGARVPAFRHTENRLNPLLREQCPHPVTWLHPDTARAHGIGEGDPLVIETAAGWAVSRARLTAGIHPDVVEAMPGWGERGTSTGSSPGRAARRGWVPCPCAACPAASARRTRADEGTRSGGHGPAGRPGPLLGLPGLRGRLPDGARAGAGLRRAEGRGGRAAARLRPRALPALRPARLPGGLPRRGPPPRKRRQRAGGRLRLQRLRRLRGGLPLRGDRGEGAGGQGGQVRPLPGAPADRLGSELRPALSRAGPAPPAGRAGGGRGRGPADLADRPGPLRVGPLGGPGRSVVTRQGPRAGGDRPFPRPPLPGYAFPMPTPDPALVPALSRETGLPARQVENTLALLEEGATVPFIARYRKERTGSLDETQIRDLERRWRTLQELEARRAVVLDSIREQGKLDPGLEGRIRAAATRTELEDLYLPYRPRRSTRADKARAAGLEPLARWLAETADPRADPPGEAARFLNPGAGIGTAEEALAGAADILAEELAHRAEVRAWLRALALEEGVLAGRVRKEWAGRRSKFEDYYDCRERVARLPSHRFLAMARGEREEVLRLSLELPEERALAWLEGRLVRHPRSGTAPLLREAARDSLQRLLAPAVEGDTRRLLQERAEEEAVRVFAANLEALLLAPPAGRKPVLGVDPGFRTGCKLAAVDGTGRFLEAATIHPHESAGTRGRGRPPRGWWGW